MISYDVTKLDFSSLIKDVEGITKHSIKTALTAVKSAWATEAKNRLSSSHKSYSSGIYTSYGMDTNGIYAEIGLRTEHTLSNMLENGFSSYDMKIGFSKSPKRKIGAEGQWYMHIPFRHHTPQANTSSSMPNEIYKQARQLPKWGRMTDKNDTKSIYNNMTKIPQGDVKNSYMTFRTVSENSPADSWIHPGFKGVNIAKDLRTHISDVFMDVFKSNMDYVHGKNRGQ